MAGKTYPHSKNTSTVIGRAPGCDIKNHIDQRFEGTHAH